jgi:hypothetical protein
MLFMGQDTAAHAEAEPLVGRLRGPITSVTLFY